jgi:putative ABC transport system permease protein
MEQDLITKAPGLTEGLPYCNLGVNVASQLNVHERDKLLLRKGSAEQVCYVLYVLPYGGQEDTQIFVHIDTAQHLAEMPGRISLIKAIVSGTSDSIDRYIAALAKAIPDADVRPVRQFTEAEGKIYNRISGLLTATVAVVLILTALCVMAAMTNVAMERKNDVGLMKAIGGATRRVLRLFLAEAAVLGLVGGALGAAAGIVLSIWLGRAVFGLAARPRLIVYPVSVALTIIVAIAGAYPLRRLANIRPASVFRGEA